MSTIAVSSMLPLFFSEEVEVGCFPVLADDVLGDSARLEEDEIAILEPRHQPKRV